MMHENHSWLKHDYCVYIWRAIEDLDECTDSFNRFTLSNIVVHVPGHVLYLHWPLASPYLKETSLSEVFRIIAFR